MRNILYIKLQTYPQPLNAIYIFVLQILLSRYLSIIKVTPHYSNYCLFNYFFHPLFLHERSISLEKNLFHSFKQKRSYCGLDVKCNVYLASKIITFLLISILKMLSKYNEMQSGNNILSVYFQYHKYFTDIKDNF